MNIHSKAPTISVVMPIYNGEPYLREAIESILNQTFTDFEFIIIDDGSTDNTWQILTSYRVQDTRLVLQRNSENLGLIKTLNKGLTLARGEFIARQDADDISLPKRLAAQVAYLQRHPDVGLLGTAYYRLYTQGERSLHYPPVSDTEIRWRLLFGNLWPHPAMMFRRELFKSGEPFYQDFLHVEDYELWIRLLKRTRAATLPTPLMMYRTHQDSICAIHYEEQARMIETISTRQIRELLSQYSLTPSEIEALQRCYRPRYLTRQDLMVGARLMFRVFSALEQQPGNDPNIVRTLRRQWIKRVLAAIPAKQWGALWISGLLQTIFRHDPIALLATMFIHLPKRTLLQIGQTFGFQKQVKPSSVSPPPNSSSLAVESLPIEQEN